MTSGTINRADLEEQSSEFDNAEYERFDIWLKAKLTAAEETKQ